ncbi:MULTISPECIES: polysialyltransferase family glycosyltransferase [unclassified Streptomyces]|uniref:polysialyltransferase family glycosyltransferase n=1 Tax=unclassified Streptomyces TaxID=2593676 RepID=UPI002DDBDE26|nr:MULTISPECIES: polysialyltransferase family glycosyltransferase [unclassified Streptomyces]WSA92804.1 alpha-2,8-polysialyltransferase family protein [Streptomyces sp. NBC_01795]WSB77174.1 alpha-2,8-polysialyltransferase family protein [Streptomyces sp. NBC_01775]WSS14561.1 alpha-2,8-polysialyltransferase family protein [Streptomyces sp. NBC_01186]WSS43380.1 alpha-2,8-polysialyltransferase family protein [Streptomyces sp. NBC_01187]
MRTQIFFASTLYGAATLAAALDADRFAPADRRLLLVSNNSANPETAPPLDAMPGFERLRDRFDRVLSWNEAIRPFHPGGWSPRTDDAPLWERYLRMLWGLGDEPGHTGYTGNDVELVLESIQVEPALAVARLFPDAPIDVYADGLMSYGPTRNKLDPLVGSRVRRLLHLELIPGLTPLLLSEFGVPAEVVPADAFTAVLAELGQDVPPSVTAAPRGGALLLGQYLSALDILTAEEEEQLHLRMLRGAAERGHRKVVFKPHPVAPARYSRALEKEAGELGVELTVLGSPVLAEVLYERMRPALVVGCFSTALLTASAFYGLPVARTGTGQLLERVTPYQNSNRIPVTLVDAVLPDLDDEAAAFEPRGGTELTGLVRAVGFCMQPQVYPELRSEAERYLSTQLDATTWRYFKRRRLTSLALPGAVPRQFAFVPRNRAVRKVARRARALKRAAMG